MAAGPAESGGRSGAAGPRLAEVDADTPGIDAAEFVEVEVPPGGSTQDVVVVVYDGGQDGDPALAAVPLEGAGGPGLVTIGSAEVPGVDLVAWTTNGLQNGPDAVALYRAPGVPAAAFVGTPAAAPPPGAERLDALVYGTGDATDQDLVAALGASFQWDEASGGPSPERSLHRVHLAGGSAWVAAEPSPGAETGPDAGTRTIAEVQGAGHRSPWEGALVHGLEGVVTSVQGDAFTLEAWPPGDGRVETSEAVDVYVQGAPSVVLGQRARVAGLVQEERGAAGELSRTRIAAASVEAASFERGARNAPLPATAIGRAGRRPPTEVVDDDSAGSAEGAEAVFDPEHDGLDFWESLEWMRVRVARARVVGPSAGFAAPVVVADGGADATGLSERGTLVWTPGDEAPERLPLGGAFDGWPEVNVGDGFSGELLGVLRPGGEIHRLDVFSYPPRLDGGLEAEVLRAHPLAPATGELSVATLNARNLSALSPWPVFLDLAASLVHGLGAPDLVAVQEIQDDSGALDDGTVVAEETWERLVLAVATIGGPAYAWADVAPEDGADGGQPGGNIRVGFLWRADGDLALVHRPGGGAGVAASVLSGPDGPELHPSPARVSPLDPAWNESRKPLAAEFRLGGATLFVVTCHFVSKSADDPTFGVTQPPERASGEQRAEQARVVRDFADEILARDPLAAVLVLGDLNDTEPSRPLEVLAEGALANLTELLPPTERSTYLYRGRAEALDHVLVSPALRPGARLAVARIHAEFHQAPSDHDPVRAELRLPHRVGPRPR